jgi:hypothetical protein
MVQIETSVGPLADLSEARWTSLSLVSSAGQILSAKIEEDGQRVKRRRVMRKCHSDGVLVREEICDTGPLQRLRSLNTLLEPSGANDTVSRA